AEAGDLDPLSLRPRNAGRHDAAGGGLDENRERAHNPTPPGGVKACLPAARRAPRSPLRGRWPWLTPGDGRSPSRRERPARSSRAAGCAYSLLGSRTSSTSPYSFASSALSATPRSIAADTTAAGRPV